MKFSHNWLNEYLTETQNPQDLADSLTLAGLEVDAIEPVAEKVTNVVVGQIKEIVKHPDADKLNICSVDVNEEELLTIVCGAKNIYAGMKAPVAKIGAVLPGNFKIKKSKLRGQASFGMMCSEEELGIMENADGLMDLPQDAPIGTDIMEYLQLNDNTIEVDLTPNRADCLSVYGIAREVSALNNAQLKPLEVNEPNIVSEEKKAINIIATDACNSYYGCIIRNVNNVQTPLWMIEKLRRSGISSISFFVDVTNYVILLTGQPMHAFDFDKLQGNINVRYANENEELILLDKTEVKLSSNTLVIADDKKALAIAGVMGGLDSSITDSTQNIFLESAFFVPEKIAGKARKYGLHTDSSHRFERGVDPQINQQAIKLAIQLITSIAGGEVAKISGSCVENKEYKNEIKLSIKKLNSLLGTSFEIKYIKDVLESLHMNVTIVDNDILYVIAPSYRFDMEIQEDLIEEIARIYGYSNLPETMPKYNAKKICITETKETLSNLKSKLVDRGYNETINYSFIDPKHDNYFFNEKGIELKNPISQDLSVMRQAIIPCLMNTFKANINRQQTRIRIFESGVCFTLKDNQRVETKKFAGLAYGLVNPTSWGNNYNADFYSVKSDIEALCSHLENLSFEVCDDIEWLHPGQSAYILTNGKRIGFIGVIHPTTIKTLQIKAKQPIVFELDLNSLENTNIPSFEKFSKFPSVSRDISFLVSKNILVGDIVNAIKNLNIDILKDVNIFDIYENANEDNNKSIALSLLFQNIEKTLDEETLVNATNNILEALKTNFDIQQRA